MSRSDTANTPPHTQEFKSYLPNSNKSSIYLRECTTDEIAEVINSLENDKASEYPNKTYKKLFTYS